MARLGKRERELKRATIKANLNAKGPAEKTDRWMRSGIAVNNMLGRTHCGYREPQNAKGSDGGRGGAQRFSEPAAIRSDNRAAYAERYQYDSRREHEARKANAKRD